MSNTVSTLNLLIIQILYIIKVVVLHCPNTCNGKIHVHFNFVKLTLKHVKTYLIALSFPMTSTVMS